MLQIWLLLGLATSLLGGGVYMVRSIKETGRAECRAEHQEAARMAELRSRERGAKASSKFENERSKLENRERQVVRDLAGVASDRACLSDGVLDTLNGHLRAARGASQPDSAVPGSTRHPGQK